MQNSTIRKSQPNNSGRRHTPENLTTKRGTDFGCVRNIIFYFKETRSDFITFWTPQLKHFFSIAINKKT